MAGNCGGGAGAEAVIRLAAESGATYASDCADGRPVTGEHVGPYRTRRYELGEDMYALLGIARTERQGRLAQWAR